MTGTERKGKRNSVLCGDDLERVRWSRQSAERLARLKQLLRRHDRDCWMIGDLVGQLLAGHRITLGMLAKQTGYSKSRLSEFHRTAAVFGKDRRDGFSFQDSLLARRISRRFGALSMGLLDIRLEIKRHGLKTLRQARAYFVRKLVQQQAAASFAQSAGAFETSGKLLNQCHHADYRDIVPLLPDGSVKLFVADPPFAAYLHLPDGSYLSGRADTSGLRTDCDNSSSEAALAVTTALFEVCLPKLAPEGCLVLFQPGGKPDRPEVLAAASANGWSCAYALTWLKNGHSLAAPGNCSEPYAVSSERLLVFTRQNEKLQWHEQDLLRSDVLTFESETLRASVAMERGERPYGDTHMFQKPLALMEFLVKKHTYPGELVVEPFGCSGSGVIAAATLGRRWLYVESNTTNFLWGSLRVSRATADLSAEAG